jgi:predicted phage-related endonuclease
VTDACTICGAEGHPREAFLTASDVARVLGVSKWGTALDVYCAKRLLVEREPMTDAQEGGHYQEPTILQWYLDKKGVRDAGRQVWITHPEYPYIGAHLDMLAENSDGDQWPVEAKAVGLPMLSHWGDEGTDAVAVDALYQAHMQAWIGGYHRTDVVALFAGMWPPKVFPIERDDEFISLLLPTLARFWDHVEDGVPPEPDFAAETTAALIRAIHPNVEAKKTVALPGAIRVGTTDVTPLQAAQVYDVAGAEIKRLESYRKLIANQFRLAMREQGGTVAELGEGAGKVTLVQNQGGMRPASIIEPYDYPKFTWPKGTRNSLDTLGPLWAQIGEGGTE